MYVFRAAYSFNMSFCVVPLNTNLLIPSDSAVAMYIESIVEAVALIVMLVLTWFIGMPVKSVCISPRQVIATPTFPTSPSDLGSSESSPNCVGRSNATLRPVCPCSKRYLKRPVSLFHPLEAGKESVCKPSDVAPVPG